MKSGLSQPQDNKQLYPLLLNTGAGWQGFRIPDVVCIGLQTVCTELNAVLDDKQMVCMPVAV